MTATVLAFDFGLRHIGVAVGNRVTGTCQALTVLRARDGVPNWQALEGIVNEWAPGLAVVGQPLNMDGSDSAMSALAEKFSRRLEGRCQLPVVMHDERLSSFEAKAQLREAGHGGDYRAAPPDAVAARLILESWLRENAEG